MTGIRSWTANVTALGIVVRIEQVSTHLPSGSSSDLISPLFLDLVWTAIYPFFQLFGLPL
jgi:hypothetical protein